MKLTNYDYKSATLLIRWSRNVGQRKGSRDFDRKTNLPLLDMLLDSTFVIQLDDPDRPLW